MSHRITTYVDKHRSNPSMSLYPIMHRPQLRDHFPTYAQSLRHNYLSLALISTMTGTNPMVPSIISSYSLLIFQFIETTNF